MSKIGEDIVLGDGTILDKSHCVISDRNLWCSITGKTMMECVEIFSDLEKTFSIKSHYLYKTYLYKGFTDLLLVQKTYNGIISVCLTWPEGEPHSVEELEDPEDE